MIQVIIYQKNTQRDEILIYLDTLRFRNITSNYGNEDNEDEENL